MWLFPHVDGGRQERFHVDLSIASGQVSGSGSASNAAC